MSETFTGIRNNNVEEYRIIFKKLEKLGYRYPYDPGSLSLLETLINDVMTYKEEVEQYKQLIKKVEKEKHNLEIGLLPYQQDNGRLALENCDLQEQLIELQKKFEKEQREFKKTNRKNELKIADLDFLARAATHRVKQLERNNKTLSLAYKNLIVKSKDAKGKSIPTTFHDIEPFIVDSQIFEKNSWEEKYKKSDESVNCKCDKMNRQTAELLEELEELKLDNQHQCDIIAALKCQIAQKDRELCRVRHTLEGGRPLSTVTQECCQQCLQKDLKIKMLEEQLKEAVDKQHEAMSRALHLAEKNQLLERELKDIDKIALAVEKECQNKVKNNSKNMDVVEVKLRQKSNEIKILEETVTSMRHKIERDELELENLRREKQVLEKNLLAATGEKKHLNDKINYFLLIEKNLNSEISRMQEINKSLQRQISDMEGRVIDILGNSCKGHAKDKQKKQNSNMGCPSSKSGTHLQSNLPKIGSKKHCNEEQSECLHRNSCVSFVDKIQQERDFYHNECHRLKDQLGALSCRTESSSEFLKQIKDLQKEIIDLKQDNFALRRENSSILKRLDCNEHLSCSSGDSLKIILDRLEKERDMALSDISRLQGERDALKERFKLAADSHLVEQSRLEKIIRDNEERIRRLETERRELISSQSSQRVSLSNMEEKCDEYKESMRKAQNELAQMKANYCQLKLLQEKTDRSMSELQSRFNETEVELRMATAKIQDLEKMNGNLEKEIFTLKKEKTELLSSVTFIEKEKDGLLITLDEKTEKVAKLEGHIKKQEGYISELMEKISHLEKKFEFTLNEKTSREYGFRNLEREVDRLKDDLQQCELQKEALIRENRRLQDDLAAAAKDCLTARRDLDKEKQDVENLKKQLQQYVSEVKKAEELLTKKESERNQMLEHFRSLSMEATTLETNNHTLESTVENTKTQLVAANNRIIDLEEQIASKESLLYSYEKQIAELTGQVAELESKLKQETERRITAEEDLNALRDLCSTLDGQKEALKKMATNHDAEKVQLMNEVRRLSEEYDGLTQKLTHERSLSQTLEKSLSNSRQETLEHKITNKDLQMHVQNLRQKVEELTQKLESESQDVRRYQSQCAELSQQVSELRREVTNARFEHARTKEGSRRLKIESEDEYSISGSLRSLPPFQKTFTWSPDGMNRVAVVAAAAAAESMTPLEMKFIFGKDREVQWESSPLNYQPPSEGPPRKLEFRPSKLFYTSEMGECDLKRFQDPTLTFCCHSDDENDVGAKETSFDGKLMENSSRNIPPLNFQEDSDRTVSLDSDTDPIKYFVEDPDNYLRKPYWKLSPLLERREGKSNGSTASELSSLPEDNQKFKASPVSEDKTEAYPTYSIRRRPGDGGNIQNEVVLMEMHTPESTVPTGNRFYNQEEDDVEDEQCRWQKPQCIRDDTYQNDNYDVSECFGSSSSSGGGGGGGDVDDETPEIQSSTPTLPVEIESDPNGCWENCRKIEILPEIDENTFSLSKS